MSLNTGAAASQIQTLYPDLENELAVTRRVLERYPEGNADWKPHEKSMALGPLAVHVAQLPHLGALLFEKDEVDIAAGERGGTANNSAELLRIFDENVAKLKGLLAKATPSDLERTWKLKFGDKVLVSEKRSILMRTLLLNHIIHHRAQLGVYFRLLGIPVPGTYGPSADEPM